MSKVDDIYEKYRDNITISIFNKFKQADQTPTKKYLPYFTKIWAEKHKNGNKVTSQSLIDVVKNFDIYSSYIEEKDIYNPIYNNVEFLRNVVENAAMKCEEKSFNKDEHIKVLLDTERFLLLQPKTHKGSLKYGATTKWCTASKTNESTFNRYVKNGFLCYLISKTNKTVGNYKKIAFYTDDLNNALSCDIQVYNAADVTVQDSTLIENGWEWEDLVKSLSYYRIETAKTFRQRKAKNEITKTLNVLKNLDLESLHKNISIIGESNLQKDLVENAQETLTNFISHINLEIKNK